MQGKGWVPASAQKEKSPHTHTNAQAAPPVPSTPEAKPGTLPTGTTVEAATGDVKDMPEVIQPLQGSGTAPAATQAGVSLKLANLVIVALPKIEPLGPLAGAEKA